MPFFQSSLTKKASSFALAVQLLLQCMLIGGASAQANDNDVNCTSTIAETICESELHGILCEALEMTGLDEDLAASEESWTVFAPTDDAFLALGDDNLEALLYNATTSGDPTATTVAADLLLFHVVQGAALMVDDLPCEAGENLLTMANGEDSRTLCIDKVPAFQKGMYNEATRTDTFIEFQVTQQRQKQKQDAAAQHYAPLPAYISATQVCNGVIYTVDQVMLFEPLPFPIPPPTEEDTIVQQEEEEEEEEEKEETSTTPEPVEEGRLDTTAPEPDSNSMTSFCEALEPGDLNFYLVRSGGTGNSQDDSFGLIPMVDLPAGLEVYVTDNAWLGEGYGFDTSEGTYKLIVPDGGIPAFKFFGHGDLLYLGEKWEPVEEGDAFQFSIAYSNDGEDGGGDELFAYCTTDAGGMNKYHVLAALSTTGKEPEEMLPDNLKMNGYGVIILPPTSTSNGDEDEDEDEDGRVVGYRYSGSAYMSADQYSKALIKANNWSPFVVSLDASSSSANSEATANGIDSHDLSPRSSSTSSFVVGDSLWMSILVTIAMVVGRNLP